MVKGNAVRQDDVPDVVAADGQVVHRHWGLALNGELHSLHVDVHRHVHACDCARHHRTILELNHHALVAELHQEPHEPHLAEVPQLTGGAKGGAALCYLSKMLAP